MKKRKANGLIPFGYKEIENDPEHIEEIPSHLEALDKIVPMIKSRSLSLREGALWLSHKRHVKKLPTTADAVPHGLFD